MEQPTHMPPSPNSSHDTASQSAFPIIHKVSWRAPFRWLYAGIRDTFKHPSHSLFYGFCFAGMGLAITSVFEHAYQYASALTSGFLLLGPFVAMGLYELSRQYERKQQPNFFDSLTVWKKNAGNLGIFSVVLIIIFLVWARASLILFALFYTNEMPNLTGFLGQILRAENLDFLAIYICVGALFATLVFAVSVVSIPMMLDRNQDAITAMLASMASLAKNPLACLIWAMLIATLTGLGFASFHIGLVILMPFIGHATWHAYRDLAGERPK